MLQNLFLWQKYNDTETRHLAEKQQIDKVKRYLAVDADDPTRIVNRYLNSWWLHDSEQLIIPSYAFVPEDYLTIHRPQVSILLLTRCFV